MDAALSPAEATFGDLLRRHRQASGLTQEELAARTGLSVRGLSDLERGVRVIPRKDTLQLLVEAFGLVGAERAALVAAAKRRSAPLLRVASDPDAPDLPVPLTPFVGRVDEVAAVCALLQRDDVRLLTLTGAGGVGKTRLALHVAQEISDSFADSARFVDLAAIREPSLVMATIAQTFGLREMGGRPLAERLAALLRDKQVLLLLDNFEQVAPAAPQVVALLAACPRLTVLVTSRSVLHVSGERAFPVPPLALPDPDQSQSVAQVAAAEAVRLFVDRAQAASPHFELDAANAPTVAAICRRLDGLPLAIALAAARVGHLPLTLLLERLERRLPMLTGGPRDQPDRLRTMRDAIAWSHDLLTSDEQRLFRRLGVFSGGFTLVAAESLNREREESKSREEAGESVLDGLASLVDGSLVWQDTHGDTPRYQMLGMIREYGFELLAASGEAETVRRRHADWCLTLAELSNDALPGPDQRLWLERTEVEHDNFRETLAWLLEQGDTEAAQRLTAVLYRFWYVRGYLSEGRTWAERALAGNRSTPTAVRARALLAAGWLAWAQGDYAQAVERVQGSLRVFRELDHASGVAEALYVLGMIAKDRDDYAQATALLMEALGLFRVLGATPWVGFVLNALGIVAYEQGQIEQATVLFTEALAQFRKVGETHGTTYALTNLGKMALAANEINQAAVYYQESLALRHKHGDQMSVAGCLRGLALIAAAVGKFEEATSLLGAAEVLRERIGLPQPRYHERFEQTVNDCRAALGEEELITLWQDGRQMPLESAVDLAIGVTRLKTNTQERVILPNVVSAHEAL
jgi:predicted ATPase/transcriptional regulator with XRE-family HTH domain/Tfp pilus assembly protein PilF